MSITVNGTTGLNFPDGTSQPTAGFAPFRNRVINGGFDVWQRGTSRTFLTGGTYGYLADRWSGGAGFQQGVHQRVTISSPPTGLRSKYALRSSSSTTAEAPSGTRLELTQKIEHLNCYDLAGQSVTLSFWVRFSAASITSSTATPYDYWTVRLQQNTTTTDSAIVSDTGDSTATVTAVSSGMTNAGGNAQIPNGSLPTTWTKHTVTFAVSSGVNNISIRFESGGLGNTASADTVWYEVAEVQLERGVAATDFERRPFATELALCQRYYEKSFDYFTAPQNGATTITMHSGVGTIALYAPWSGSHQQSAQIPFKVEKRVAPTMIRYGSSDSRLGYLLAGGFPTSQSWGTNGGSLNYNANVGIGSFSTSWAYIDNQAAQTSLITVIGGWAAVAEF